MQVEQNIINGWLGETATANALRRALDCETYKLLNNVIIPTSGGGTAQIDHIIISVHAICVIETKNYAGRIFGDENSPEWLQQSGGSGRTFPNPLRQNWGHLKALAEFLHYPQPAFENIVFFAGECTFGTSMPANVLSSGLRDYILDFKSLRLSTQQVSETAERLRFYSGTFSRDREHIRNIDARLYEAEPCPRCGKGRLTLRKSRGGQNFWGCSHFPVCRFTRSLNSPFPQTKALTAQRSAEWKQAKSAAATPCRKPTGAGGRSSSAAVPSSNASGEIACENGVKQKFAAGALNASSPMTQSNERKTDSNKGGAAVVLPNPRSPTSAVPQPHPAWSPWTAALRRVLRLISAPN
jgi:ribosomal protein L37AE/L43A